MSDPRDFANPSTDDHDWHHMGITKREYAFWQCMNGLLSRSNNHSVRDADHFAYLAMAFVDAGFAELNKESES